MKKLRAISNTLSLTGLFNNLARQKEIAVFAATKETRFHANMVFQYKTGSEPLISWADDAQTVLKSGEKIEISFFFKETFFTFESVIIDVLPKLLTIKLPQMVNAAFDRSGTRYRIPKNENVFLTFHGTSESYRVLDISINGLSFEADKKLFNEAETVRNVFLKIDDSRSVYLDVNVKYEKCAKNAFRYGLNFVKLEWESFQLIFNYIFERCYPDIKSLESFSEEEISRLYDESRYSGLIRFENQKNDFLKEIRNFKKILNKPMISANLVYQKNNKLIAAGSALRIFNRTFLGHQTLIVPEARLSAKVKADIIIGLAENLSSHPYFENFIMYIDSDFDWYHGVFENIGRVIDDKDNYKVDFQECYEFNLDKEETNGDCGMYQTEIPEDPSEFIGYMAKSLTALELSCFGYDDNNFNLNEIKEVYQSIGFSVSRRLFCTKESGRILAFAVAECFSEEMNFKSTVNSLRIYLLEGNVDSHQLLNSILLEAGMFFISKGIKKFNILVKLDENMSSEIALTGSSNNHHIMRVMMNKEGISEFYRLLTSNFENYTKFYYLTQPQKAIWFTEKVYSGTSIGNVAGTLKMKEEIDRHTLERAINIFVEKNDAMRIRVVEENGEPKQYIKEYEYFKVDFIDFSSSEGESDLYKWDIEQTQIPFTLIDSDLCYFTIIKVRENFYCMYARTHHMISDAWTMSLICTQVIELYNNLKNGVLISKAKKPSYIDFILDLEEYRYSERFNKSREFWSDKFRGLPELASIKPTAKNSLSTKACRKKFILSGEISANAARFCSENKTSIFSLFMAVFSIYISSRTTQKDVVIGTPVLNRSGVKEKETAGIFVSAIPVRLTLEDNLSFVSFVKYVTRELSSCFKNQKYNYELILKDFREQNRGREKLYDCMLSYQNSKYEKGERSEIFEARWHFNKNQVESLIVHIDDREDEGEYLLNIDYLTDLFNEEEIEQFFKDLIKLLRDALKNPDKEIYKLNALSENEKIKLLEVVADFNKTNADYPKDKTIHQMFEEQAERTPDKTAVQFGDESITYRELNEKANQLAGILREKGVVPDSLVGIMVYRSIEMIIGIMGILKSGGAYLPIDPEYPQDRINYMLQNGNVKIVLTGGNISNAISDSILKLVLDDAGLYHGEVNNLENVTNPNNLAYVIYTSGSTGKPKGVMIEHYSVINRLNWMQKKYPIYEEDVILQKTPFTFDVSVWELFWWSFYGAKLVLLCPGGEKEPSKIIDAVYKSRISIIHFVPSMLSVFLDFVEKEINTKKVESLRQVFASGEALTIKHCERFFKVFAHLDLNLSNLYGPTEATVDVTYFDCKKEDNLKVIPIGKPIDNTRLYILNEDFELQPPGICGELFIAGDGLARGYLNNTEITSQKFLSCPFIKGERMYRTGDWAKWLPNGDVEYLGRIDGQVKIRGLRIELGEIEYLLLKHESIKEAVVIDRKDEKGNSYLCAYFVSNSEIAVSELRAHLSHNLPAYMIPSYFVKLEKLPLSMNGKTDRKRLPEPYNFVAAEEEYIEPRNDLERTVAEIWKEVLNKERIGVKDDFFLLGGDSLNAINIAAKIGQGVSISDIYSFPTVEMLAKNIEQGSNEKGIFYTSVKAVNNDGTSVVCIPYGGGAPVVYNELGRALSDISNKYSLYSVNLPGHDIGNTEDKLNSIEDIASACVEEIKKRLGAEIILYGHCVGSALTVEIARLLEKEQRKIKAVLVGGVIPPRLVRFYGNVLDPWKWKTDEGIIKYLNKLGGFDCKFDKDELTFILKAFRHDVRGFMRYFHDFFIEKKAKLKTPLYCIIGENDLSTKGYSKKYKGWRNFSEKINLITLAEANHYFVKSHALELAKIIDSIREA